MKILYDHQIFSRQKYGGISRYFHEIANHISLGNDSARIFAPLHVNEYISSGGLKVPKIAGARFLAEHISQGLGRLLIKPKRDIDIFHQTYYADAGYLPPPSKCVVTVYDMIHERFPDSFKSDDQTSRLKEAAVHRADHVICISESTRRDLIEIMGVSPEKTSVVHLGYSLTRAGVGHSPVSRPYLLYVGARDGYKNFERLLLAYAQSKLGAEISLVCFGGGGTTPKEASLLESAGLNSHSVIFMGGDDSLLSRLYASATALIYPSMYEGFGIPPLEAMSHGCPVICSNAASLPEVVGDAAELFDPLDQDAICSSLLRVVQSSERASELALRGTRRIEMFSWEKCAKETLDVYKRLLVI